MTKTTKFDLQTWLAGTEREIRRDGERVRSLALRRRFDASIDRVWAAWTDGWKTKIASGEPRVGGKVELDLGQPHRTTCQILACDPPTRLAATWAYGEPTGARPDEVEVRLSRDGDGTVLELEHRSDSDAPWAAGVGSGWEAGVMLFEFMFHGEDQSPWASTFEPLEKLWTELVGSEPSRAAAP